MLESWTVRPSALNILPEFPGNHRHGARTPLSPSAHLWKGTEWDVCGRAYTPVPLRVLTAEGKERPHNEHNAKQV